MHNDEHRRVALSFGTWWALSLIGVLRFFHSAYSANKFVFLIDLLLPKAFFLFVAIAILLEEKRRFARHLLFLASVCSASTLPQLWAPFWLAMGILAFAAVLAGIAFLMEVVSKKED